MVLRSSLFTNTLMALPVLSAAALGMSTATAAYSETAPRITAQVEGSPMVALPGEVHPWARAQFDRGPAPASLSGRMLLTLKRSQQQEEDLQQLIAAQQDPNSPSYHKWLSPEEFGARFGVADADLQTISGYLSSRGVTVERVFHSHMALEISANAGQMRSAFGTEIHSYAIGGKTFYANQTAPMIPAALRGVVSGFASLNNFAVRGGTGAGTPATIDSATHKFHALYTTSSSTYAMTPADIAVEYDVPVATSTTAGNGGLNVNVGVIGDSNINVNYVNNYRSIFGQTAKPPTIIVDGDDPGINNDAYIAYKQIELIGAVAPNANIYYYTSATTNYDTGLDFAYLRAIEDNQVQVLAIGFQSCESALGSTLQFLDRDAEQAAAQGMTVVVDAGNTGAAGCEVPGTAAAATTGYAVNGYASSPFVTAVGGTDFNYGATATSTYWNSTNNSTTQGSLLKYVPEQAWNDSITTNDSVKGTSVLLAGGGGVSTLGYVGLDFTAKPQPMPAYQAANANAVAIGGTSRVIPDIAYFAGTGANNSMGYNNTAYAFCMQSADCTGSSPQFTYSGGTEASSAIFAGAMALVVNKLNATTSSRFGVGNANPALYSLIANAKTVGHDVTTGSAAVSCTGSTNCNNGTMTGYAAGTGYDAATGLGSIDIGSLVSTFALPNTTTSAVTLSITDPATGAAPVCTSGTNTTTNCSPHSRPVAFNVTVTGAGATPTGDIALFATTPLASQQVLEYIPLSGGKAADNYYLQLPGGTYKLFARYAGNTTYAPSVSASTSFTVQSEPCKITVFDHNVNYTSTNIAYGSPVVITVEPFSTASTASIGIPSGSINVTDTFSGATSQITTLPFNSLGSTTFSSNLLQTGQHSLVFSYAGDASFGTCSSSAFMPNVTIASTTTTLNAPESDTGGQRTGGNPGGSSATLGITAVVQSATLPSNGTAPTGSVMFSTATARTIALTSGFDANGNAISTASTTIGKADIPSSGSITATYIPASTEKNYTGSSSSAVPFQSTTTNVVNGTTTTFTITDKNGTQNADGSTTLSYPTQDTLTLNMTVNAYNPQNTVFLVYANGVQISPPVTRNGAGFVTGGGVPIASNGTATFVVPQLNGYLSLPSGNVQLTVIYDGWIAGKTESAPSTANQLLSIVDDRTSADFSLLSDSTVNQSAPLTATANTATYNLRLTSIYNFQSAYPNTAINLSCSVVAYTNASGVRSTPAGVACGFNNLLTATTASVTFAGNATTPGFITQALYVGAATGYVVVDNRNAPSMPATRWWLATGGTTLACIFLLGVPSRRRHWQSLLGVAIVGLLGFGLTGCGLTMAKDAENQIGGSGSASAGGAGNSSSSSGGALATPIVVPAGTYTVVVTATTTTNTTLVHTLPVQVLVGSYN